MKKKIQQEIYQIKVTLLGTDPPIWRRLLVPTELTLAQFHDVLQAAMGWQDSHLHEIQIGRKRFGRPDLDESGASTTGDERTVRLSNLLSVGARAVYTYDFGDDWGHAIAVESVLPSEEERTYPLCLDGEGHGPPEDCGGVSGYTHLVRILRDPYLIECREARRWLGSRFDPEDFSASEVSRRLMAVQQRWHRPDHALR